MPFLSMTSHYQPTLIFQRPRWNVDYLKDNGGFYGR